ncbi:MAG: hypothetical protein IRZ15_02925 [Bryobacteraceae bacterium]|nr:hypothetical protein [Bryobacteraceae bacterium]
MSVQYFLQGKLLGIESFLLSGVHGSDVEAGASPLPGRSRWVTLLTEVLPRALLAELGLARILLGSSGGGQFLVVLPLEVRQQAEEFLANANAQIQQMSGGELKLVWAGTENLGDWSDVRKRITEAMSRERGTPAAGASSLFEPFDPPAPVACDGYFSQEMFVNLRDAGTVGWSQENPGRIEIGSGKHQWTIGSGPDSIPVARHTALDDEGRLPASLETLAMRAEGRHVWGVLRGDVDNFGIRLRRAQTIEEHIQLSVVYKQFFAGELEVLCSLPEFWRKVTVLYSGGDDFAVYGSWDSLILLAREIQRLFHRLSEEALKEYPGPEGKTISMALALAPSAEATLASVYDDAGRMLKIAKSTARDSFHLFGQTLEWKGVGDAAGIKDTMTKMIKEFGCPRQFLSEIGSFYREGTLSGPKSGRGKGERFERPWRFHRRLSRVLGPTRERELLKLRSELTSEFLGRNPAQGRLRPAGRVALEWASLLTEA